MTFSLEPLELLEQNCFQSVKDRATSSKYPSNKIPVSVHWSDPEPNLPNNYGSAMSQLYSMDHRLQRDPNMKQFYQQSVDTGVEKGFVKTLGKSEVKGTFGKECYLPRPPVVNPNKSGGVRRDCNAAAGYKDVYLNDKLLAGPDLIHGLIGTIFGFWERPIALTAIIKSMFPQPQFPKQNKSYLSFGDQQCTNLCKLTSISVMFLMQRVQQHEQATLWSGDRERGRVSNCSKGNPKQLLRGRFHQVRRHTWRNNQCFQATATSFVKTWLWTKKTESPTAGEWPSKSLRTWDQSAMQSKCKWNQLRWVRHCLDISGMLLNEVCKFTEVPAK